MSTVGGYLSNIFGKSPFQAVQVHMSLGVEAAEMTLDLLRQAEAGNWTEVERLREEISRIEARADDVKSNIRSQLPRGFLLPVARADLLDLLTRQDKLANRAEDIAGLIAGRQLQFPPEIQAQASEYADVCVDTARLAGAVVKELDELLVSGFSGREASQVIAMIEAVEARERHSDRLQAQLRRALFAIEDDLPPVGVMFLYRLFELLADFADISERVAHRIQMMLAK